MRTTALVTGYIEAAFFLLLGFRCIVAWQRQHDRASAHLAMATGLFGISSLVGALSTTLFDQTKGHLPPRGWSIIASVIGLLAIYAFLVFLSDFIRFPAWLMGIFGVATIAWIVLAIIERPDLTFDKDFNRVYIHGIHNPIHYLTYVGAILAYYAVVLGILWIAFFVNGVRLSGLARLRMLLIAAGFFLLFVAIGLIPRILFGHPDTGTNRAIITAVEYIAIASAPFLLLGFSPPKWLSDRYGTNPAA
jgi:MFS family permease